MSRLTRLKRLRCRRVAVSLAFFLLSGMALPGLAQIRTVVPAGVPTELEPPTTTDPTADVIRIPFSIENNLPIVSATVGGRRLNLVADLGGFKALAVDQNSLRPIPVMFGDRPDSWLDLYGYQQLTRSYTANDFQAGDLNLDTIEGTELTTPLESGQPGFIGRPVWAKYMTVFDFVQKEIRLYPFGSQAAFQAECGSRSIPLRTQGNAIISSVQTDQGMLTFQWDTGISDNLLKPSSVGMEPTNVPQPMSFSQFSIAGQDMGVVGVSLREFATQRIDGILGGAFFQSKVVCFDLKNRLAGIR